MWRCKPIDPSMGLYSSRQPAHAIMNFEASPLLHAACRSSMHMLMRRQVVLGTLTCMYLHLHIHASAQPHDCPGSQAVQQVRGRFKAVATIAGYLELCFWQGE